MSDNDVTMEFEEINVFFERLRSETSMLVINPNPCFDRTLSLSSFSKGAIMRGESAVVTAGGKGINVARVLRAFKREATLAVLVGALDETKFIELLEAEGANPLSVRHPGIVRVATIIFEKNGKSTTIINEKGSVVDKADWSRFVAKLASQIKPDEIVSCMGSFPSGIDQDSIQELVDVIKLAQGVILFDSSPQFLEYAIQAGVDIVSPNLDEAEALIYSRAADHFIDDLNQAQDRAKKAATELVNRGVKVAFVTTGSEGVAIATKESVHFINGVNIKLVSAVGAGDSFVAGVMLKYDELKSLGEEIDWVSIAAFGVATASASCEQLLSGGVEPKRCLEIYQQVISSKDVA